jgi:hypothetical protein
MKKSFALAPFALVLFASLPLWSQDVAEAARAARERAKTSKRAAVTLDDTATAGTTTSSPVSWNDALQNMRKAFHDVCSDPQTDKGKLFTDAQMNTMQEAAKPLRERDAQLSAKEKDFNERFAQLDREQEQAIANVVGPAGKPNEEQRKQVDAINQDFDVRRKALKAGAEDFLANAAKLRKEVAATSEECPEAAKRL